MELSLSLREEIIDSALARVDLQIGKEGIRESKEMYQKKLKKLHVSMCLSCRMPFVSFRRNDAFCCEICAKSFAEPNQYFLNSRAFFIRCFEEAKPREIEKPKIFCPQCGREVVIGVRGKFCTRRCSILFWEETS